MTPLLPGSEVTYDGMIWFMIGIEYGKKRLLFEAWRPGKPRADGEPLELKEAAVFWIKGPESGMYRVRITDDIQSQYDRWMQAEYYLEAIVG